MKCLRTGCFLKVDQQIYHCDLFCSRDSELLIFKGFAKESSPYYESYDVEILETGDLNFSSKFVDFMKEWNRNYMKCLEWNYKIEDVEQKVNVFKFIYKY